MSDQEVLADRFEAHRSTLKAVAYRMLGSVSEADDAVQEAWLRLSRSDASGIENLGGWLTTVVGRVCLDMLRWRRSRGEESLDHVHVPDPVVSLHDGVDPEREALVEDSVGLALLVVLDTLAPEERVAFVLHDMFAVPFDQIAPMVGRTPTAARQLASRARRRAHGAATPDTDLVRQREVVAAFLTAARGGDFDALVAVLDPDVVLRADTGAVTKPLRGAAAVAGRALSFQRLADYSEPVLVNGAPGLLTAPDGRPTAIMAFTIANGKIVAIDLLADLERLRRLDLPALGG
jgi:RNA polymerase sigma-70 factor, ECF subfamily